MPSHPTVTMEAMERLLVLGAGAGQLGLLAAARARGLFVIAVDRDPRAPGFRYADRRAIVSVEDEGRRARALVRSSRELRGAVRAALRASRIGLCLIEELAEEPVVTVSAFSRDGLFHPLVVTDRAPLAHVWETEHADEATALAGRATEALGIREGPSTTLVAIGRDGPRVLEVSARIGGGHEAELCEAAVGVDLHGLALAAALGKEIPAKRLRPRRLAGGACVHFLPGGGEAQGLEEAGAAPGVVWARSYGGSERAGAVLAVGSSRDEALARATAAAECIRFVAADAQAV